MPRGSSSAAILEESTMGLPSLMVTMPTWSASMWVQSAISMTLKSMGFRR